MGSALLSRPRAFERGDKVYLTTPVMLGTPSEQQVEEFAFASAVRTKAPNENIGWLSGRYVEAERANLNNAMWLSDELALKSLTPMLCPVTVMHDPRTAVGCIADCKLFTETASTRIETILGIWRHRFPEVWEEAEVNIAKSDLAQSMECYSPWYTCSDCERAFVKLPLGAEKASWCDHLLQGNSRRILRDVCFTGTGLIFGTRGGIPAYTEAQLDHFQDEIAEAHDRSHHDSTYRPSQRSAKQMALVQIEESELATLRNERNEARTKVDELSNTNRELTTKVEKAEADKVAAETAKTTAETEVTKLTEKASATELRDKRLKALGAGFTAKLGETTKTVLTELAGKASDEEWDVALKEREEMAGVKRDTAGEPGTTPAPTPTGDPASPTFASEEVASFMRSGAVTPPAGGAPANGATAVRSLARAFDKSKRPAPAGNQS